MKRNSEALPPRCAVLILNYNSATYACGAIQSIDAADVHIFVIDNASTQSGELTILHDLERTDARVTVVELPTNNGFGEGINRGVEEAGVTSTDFLWILNPDTVCEPGTFDRLRAELIRDPLGVCSPTIRKGLPPGRDIWFDGGSVDLARMRVKHSDTHAGASVPFLSGASLAMTGAVWEKIGPFREDLFMYWEDVEWSLRCAARGVALTVLPDVAIWHLEGRSSGKDDGRSNIYYKYVNRNRMIVGSEQIGALKMLFGPPALVTIGMLTTPLRQERVKRWSKFLSAAGGVIDGYMAIRALRRSKTSTRKVGIQW